jgi:transcriptional regulator with XRE-family HTH domain
MRVAAGLSGNALAKRMGMIQSRQWKIEHGELLPTEDDIRAWVRSTGESQQVAAELTDMLAEARIEHQSFKVAYRKGGGGAAYQEQVRAIEERSTRIGEFQVAMIPAILQTADYAREILSLPSGPAAWGSDKADIDAMIDGRLRRQEILYDTHKRIQVVLGEAALRTLVCRPETLGGQLEKLLSVIRLPALELGIIGFSQPIPVFPFTAFSVRDDDLIVIERLTGEQYLRADESPEEVAAFLKFFDLLREAASTGAQAEAIIRNGLEILR